MHAVSGGGTSQPLFFEKLGRDGDIGKETSVGVQMDRTGWN